VQFLRQLAKSPAAIAGREEEPTQVSGEGLFPAPSILSRLVARAARLLSFAPEPDPGPESATVAPQEADLRPPSGHVGRARVALLTIIPEEFAAAQGVFDLYENIPGTGYFAAEAVGLQEWDVVLMQATDRSNVPVMGDVLALMEDLRPQIIVLLGIAGGLCDDDRGREDIGPGDVLIADQVTYVEFLKLDPKLGLLMRSYAIDHPSVPLRKSVATPIQKTYRISEHIGGVDLPENRDFKIHIGSIVSGEKVLGDVKSHVQKELLKPFDKALAVDMESIGIARAVCDGRGSFWYHPRYVVIRGISDLVSAANNDEMRTDWKPFAAHAAALVAYEFVRRLPIDERAV
jgi:nucleoside phosphorylase